MKSIQLIIIFYLISFNILSQNDIDSLFNKFNTLDNNDSNKLNTAILICKKLNKYGNYKRNLSFCDTVLKFEKANINATKRGMILINKAIALTSLSDYPNAIDTYYQALTIFEKEKYQIGEAKCYINLGIIFYEQKQYNKALNLYFRSKNIASKFNLIDDLANCYNNIGIIYDDLDKIDSAIYFYDRSINQAKINNNIGIISYVNDNLTTLYIKQNKFQKALKLAQENLEIFLKQKDEFGISFGNITLGIIYNKLKQPNQAIACYKIAFDYAKKENAKTQLRDVYYGFSNSFELKRDLEKALKYYKAYKETVDTIFNTENSSAINDAKTSFELEKKEIELKTLAKAELDKREIKNSEEKQRQRIIIYAISGGFFLVILLVLFIYRGLQQKQKDNAIIKQQKNEVEYAKLLIEQKHKEITDSINYAERIQRSFLATKELLDENLKEYFVYFKPKDIVSGDFYWGSKLINGNFILVTADSTGHGVPGAIMSMLNISCLNEAINADKLTQPSDILNATRKKIIEHLLNDGSADGGKDGMDCSLISFDFKNKKLIYAAANNPVWIIRNKEFIALEADRMPIGKHDKDSIPFTQHEVELKKGDTVYTFTDGFADQFGGPRGKKFMYKQLENLLLSISHESMEIQKQKLEAVFENWKGDLEQVDDVCVIGVRI